MSASPAGAPSGPASTTPNGGMPPAVRRKRPQGNPFIAKGKPARRQAAPPATNGASNPHAHARPANTPLAQAPNGVPSGPAQDPDDDPSTFSEYPLVATRKSLLETLRYHAMRLMSTTEANPYDTEQFTRPLRLHRRFPRDKLNDMHTTDSPLDNKDREKEEIRKAERQAEKEANQAQIAPTEKAAAAKKRPQFKKKVEDVFYPQDTPEAQKRAKLRYEEGRPWHLEDFDGKNTWVGTYEEPLSESHAMLVLDNDGHFRMVPLEKWYRFTPTGRYKTMDLDEAERHMSKKVKDSRWFLETTSGVDAKKRAETERIQLLERGRVGMRGERRAVKNEDDEGDRPDFANDVDEIDFEHDDEFQDDDEGKLFAGEEEDVKESERRIRQEQLGANVFAGTGVKEEKDWDEEEEKEKQEADAERKKARKLRKHLVKRERKYEYESESDHPYSEESESEDSETERLKEEEERKKEEERLKTNGDRLPSGSSSHGTNTPSGRAEKHADSLSRQALKRPGSPNLSEASGTESTHKRIKKHRDANGHTSSRAMSPSGVEAGRSLSPNAVAARRAMRGAAGTGSDTEASGTERGPRIRLQRSPPGSPPASATQSRSASPKPSGAATPTMPTIEEIKGAIPEAGISILDLIKRFRAQIPKGKEGTTTFISLVKQVGRYAPHDKSIIVQR